MGAQKRTLQERQDDPKRVFGFRFNLRDKQQKEARRLLEIWEQEYNDQLGDETSALAHIITTLVLEYNGTKIPLPESGLNQFSQLVMKQIETLTALVRGIYTHNPSAVTAAIEQQKQDDDMGEMDNDFIDSLFGDFNNTSGVRD